LKYNRKKILENKKILAQFLRQVHTVHDSPSLIKLVAYDRDYLVLVGAIVNAGQEDDPKFFESLTNECQLQGLDINIMQEKLRPVALSLGLAVSSKIQTDYYGLLGITPDADVNEIKKNYRELAYKTHPDTSSEGQDSNQAFVELNAAYHTLTTPDLRHQYDQSRSHLGLWKEQEDKPKSRGLNIRHLYQFGGLLVFFVLVALVSNFVFQQNALTDDPYADIQVDIEKTEVQNKEAGLKNKSEARLSMGRTDNVEEDLPKVQKKNTTSAETMELKLYEPKLTKRYMASLTDKPESFSNAKPQKSKDVVAEPSETHALRYDHVKENVVTDSPIESNYQPIPGTGHDLVKTDQPIRDKESEAQRLELPTVVKDIVKRKDKLSRVQSFLRTYCKTYEDKNLAKFIGFFTPDATEMGKPFHKLLPKYRKNFKTIDSIKYKIELEQYSYKVNTGDINIRGRFFLDWRKDGGSWQKNTGNISMTLFEDNDSFLIKDLNYSFNSP